MQTLQFTERDMKTVIITVLHMLKLTGDMDDIEKI